ncbi:radical SAM domain protein, partial [gut metagenome]
MIHQYVNNGYHIVLDVNSGSVHVVDELCYDVIQALDTMGIDQAENPVEELKKEETEEGLLKTLAGAYPESDLKDAYGDIVELTEAGQLFTKDIYEQYIGEVKQRKTVVKALCLH